MKTMDPNQLILARLDALSAQVAQLSERQRARDELIDEMTPIAREALATAIGRLDALEKQGVFAFAAEVANVGKRVAQGFSPEDVRQLGDAAVSILDVVRALTRPEVLRIASDAAAALREADRAKPLGAFGAMRATRDDDVQKGLGMFVDLLRRVGHGLQAAEAAPADRKAKLAELLGPRRERKQLPAPRREAPPAPATAKAAPPAKPAPNRPPACAVPSTEPVDLTAWSRSTAEALARELGVALAEPHWAIIDAARADFAATNASPNIQRLTQVAKVSTRELYTLFPKAPARTVAKLAGLPKPAGCL